MENNFKFIVFILFLRVSTSVFLICFSLKRVIIEGEYLSLLTLFIGAYLLLSAIKDFKQIF